MRVLSFTNIPMPAVTQRRGAPGIVIGGWLGALQMALAEQPDLVMGFASVSSSDYAPFCDGNTTYFNILVPAGHRALRAWLHAWQHPIDFPDAIQRCKSIVDQFRPDIIHVHGTESFFGLIQAETRIPVLVSLQGLLTIYVKRYFEGLVPADAARDILTPAFLKGGSLVHQYWLMERAARREQQIVKLCSYFQGGTAWDRGFVSLVNPSAHYYHCDAVLRKRFYSGSWQPAALDRKVIYYVSAGAPYKGLECLLEAVRLLELAGFSGLTLKVSGPLQGTYMWPVLERRIRQLHLASETVWLGPSSAEEIAFELEHASVFAHPSHIDNWPNTLAEAMLVGTPCIASFVGGIPSMMEDGTEGLLFPAGDPYFLADRITRILTNPALARELSEQASARARMRHDPRRIASRMMAIYREVSANGTQRPEEQMT